MSEQRGTIPFRVLFTTNATARAAISLSSTRPCNPILLPAERKKEKIHYIFHTALACVSIKKNNVFITTNLRNYYFELHSITFSRQTP